MDGIDEFEELPQRETTWQRRDHVTVYRKHVLINGYLPIPSNGKIPPMSGWQDIKATPKIIDSWGDQYPDAENTSILTRTTPALDIDIMGPDAAEAAEALVRETYEERGYILIRIGRSPKRAILFRTDKPFKKIVRNFTKPGSDTVQKLEMLGMGQQIVVAGVHPDTGQPYRWHGGEPDKIKREDLPYISESEAQDLIDKIAQMLIAEFGFVEATQSKAKNGNGEDFGDYYAADWAALIDNILRGAALHDSIRDLAAAVVRSGMHDTAAERLIRSIMEASPVPHDERWQKRLEDIRRAIQTARDKFGGGEKEEKWEDAAAEDDEDPFVFVGDAPPAPPKELIRDLLYVDGVTILGGQTGAAKTLLEIHKAVCLATGTPFFGHRIIERVGTAFVFAEGRALIPNRFAAEFAANNIDKKLPIAWIKQLPDFSSVEGAKRFIKRLNALNERMQGDHGARLGQFVIDTITALFSMKDEDDNAEATKICNTLRRIYEATGALACGVHHYGKNPASGLRGASAFKACSDLVLGSLAEVDPLSGQASDRELVCTKARDGEQGPISPFELVFVKLGLRDDGEPYGSVHVVPTPEGQSRFDMTAKLSKSQRAIRDAITEVIDGRGKMITLRAGMSPVMAARVIDVQEEFNRRYVVPTKGKPDPKKTEHAKYVAFKRALDNLPVKEFGSASYAGEDWIWHV
jgi:hypothetical protein